MMMSDGELRNQNVMASSVAGVEAREGTDFKRISYYPIRPCGNVPRAVTGR